MAENKVRRIDTCKLSKDSLRVEIQRKNGYREYQDVSRASAWRFRMLILNRKIIVLDLNPLLDLATYEVAN